ncbi:MAG: inositol monophosphatase [Candidatus Omnitrophica bacterium]|nr:inositol monophosphatase [Candidatus Omnitrophota bacterium]MCM8811192.1 inositol monophosphatase [Candidatus Omnitrophota bacterium]
MKRFDLGIKVVKLAGKYLKENFNKVSKLNEDRYDIKLLQDIESEKILLNNIKNFFPEDSFLSEETKIPQKNKKNLWIIDPLDGSLNFSRGIPHFCISIAFIGEDEKFGIVYDFFKDELFTGIEGEGAYLNGKRIKVSKTDKIEESVLAIGFMRGKKEILYGLKLFNMFANKVKKIRIMGSASLDFCYLSSGRIDLLIHLNLNRWDYEAGIIILKEAGGKLEIEKYDKIRIFKATNGKLLI